MMLRSAAGKALLPSDSTHRFTTRLKTSTLYCGMIRAMGKKAKHDIEAPIEGDLAAEAVYYARKCGITDQRSCQDHPRRQRAEAFGSAKRQGLIRFNPAHRTRPAVDRFAAG